MHMRKSLFKPFLSLMLAFAMVIGSAALPSTDTRAATKKPKKCTITKIDQSGSSMTIYWKNVGCYGYHVQVSEQKSFPAGGTYNAKGYGDGTTLQWHKVDGLSYGCTYYVRVRGYNLNGSKKVYGTWSSKKTVSFKIAPKLSKGTEQKILSGRTRSFRIKNIKKSQVSSLTVVSADKMLVAPVKNVWNGFYFSTGWDMEGKTKVTVTLKLKKAINGKKIYKWIMNVEVLHNPIFDEEDDD